jgi:branched-chain amino acid transport system permease protein
VSVRPGNTYQLVGWRNLAWVLALGGILAAPHVFDPLGIFVLTDMAIKALFASSLNLLLGYSRLVSFGHAAFLGLGAYTTGISLQRINGLSIPAALLLGALLAGAVAVVVGYFCVRRDRVYFAMLTLAFAQVIQLVVIRMSWLTGGEQGLTGTIPRLPISLGLFTLNPSDPVHFFYLAAITCFVCLGLMRVLLGSPYGYALCAVARNPTRAEHSGIPVKRLQLIVFVVAATFAGMAGGLHATYQLSVFPEVMHWTISAQAIVMVLLGGIGYFLGPAVGAAALVLLQMFASAQSGYAELVLGGLLLVIVLGLPGGILGGLAGAYRRLANLPSRRPALVGAGARQSRAGAARKDAAV